MTEIVPATEELLTQFLGAPPSRTVRAFAAVRGDEVLGVAGIYAKGDGWVVFADLTDEIRADRRLIVKGYRLVMAMLKERATSAISIADPHIKGSEVLLKHMGFKHASGEAFVWLH